MQRQHTHGQAAPEDRRHSLRLIQYHFFFFQAEDGIRDYKVTGVQTCALPISIAALVEARLESVGVIEQSLHPSGPQLWIVGKHDQDASERVKKNSDDRSPVYAKEIGRASCRERV